MPEIYYRKVGRRYQPLGVYDLSDSYPQGCHLVVVDNDCRYTRFDIKPDIAAVEAIKKLCAAEITQIIADATAANVANDNARRKTDKQYQAKCERAWRAYHDIMGDDSPVWLSRGTCADMAEKIVEKLIDKARKLDGGAD